MTLFKRLKNLWFLSGISKEDIKENPHNFMNQYVNAQEYQGQAYIVGLSDEEQSFKESLNYDNKDTLLT